MSDEFTLVYKIMKLQVKNTKFVHQPELSQVPKYSTIVTDRKTEFPSYHVIKANKRESPLRLKRKIINQITNGKKSGVVIGIDPGLSIGLAILSNQRILETTTVFSVRASIQWIKDMLKQLNSSCALLRIGDGMKQRLDTDLLQYYRELKDRVSIEIVDESYSSIKSTNKITIHEQAAVIIAKREGTPYKDGI